MPPARSDAPLGRVWVGRPRPREVRLTGEEVASDTFLPNYLRTYSPHHLLTLLLTYSLTYSLTDWQTCPTGLMCNFPALAFRRTGPARRR